mmetsp:Transcript_48958/g.137051  ORF Transcript_48958/g.137051 Transcript_48958/m.137051 type:complete len:84 (+) Transcript_48958:122-373(+)
MNTSYMPVWLKARKNQSIESFPWRVFLFQFSIHKGSWSRGEPNPPRRGRACAMALITLDVRDAIDDCRRGRQEQKTKHARLAA